VEAVKKPSRVGSKLAKARSSNASKLKRNIVPKASEHRGSATQQIAGWLEKLGMSEYAERFAENRIDLLVLPDLTDQDLEKLGVVLGDRHLPAAAHRPHRELDRAAGRCRSQPANVGCRSPSDIHRPGGRMNMIMFWAAVLAISVLLYVLLDGFDLGVGILPSRGTMPGTNLPTGGR
jgi:hypothetical protein